MPERTAAALRRHETVIMPVMRPLSSQDQSCRHLKPSRQKTVKPSWPRCSRFQESGRRFKWQPSLIS